MRYRRRDNRHCRGHRPSSFGGHLPYRDLGSKTALPSLLTPPSIKRPRHSQHHASRRRHLPHRHPPANPHHLAPRRRRDSTNHRIRRNHIHSPPQRPVQQLLELPLPLTHRKPPRSSPASNRRLNSTFARWILVRTVPSCSSSAAAISRVVKPSIAARTSGARNSSGSASTILHTRASCSSTITASSGVAIADTRTLSSPPSPSKLSSPLARPRYTGPAPPSTPVAPETPAHSSPSAKLQSGTASAMHSAPHPRHPQDAATTPAPPHTTPLHASPPSRQTLPGLPPPRPSPPYSTGPLSAQRRQSARQQPSPNPAALPSPDRPVLHPFCSEK